MQATRKSETLVMIGLRVPPAHAEAVRAYAERLAETTRVRVTASAAGAAVLEAGLVALGLIEVSGRMLPASAPPPTASPTAKRGANRKTRKP